MPNESGAPRGTRALIVLASVAIAAYALDQFSKFLVESNLTLGEQVRVLGDVLVLHFVKNPGAAFSLASGSTWIFSILAAVVTVVIIVFARKIRSIGWGVVFGLLLGGVLGNLTDRLFREPSFGLGHVVDFISTPWMLPAIYNVADICIVTSMGLFILLTLRGINMDGTRSISAKRAAAEAKDLADAEPAARSTDEPLR
ncbi:signal peptidase II [Okibacterium fritillariae]|uniref:Lipoprotein signal peptidase n=1 Tax=Okibacterium fritillariae TaxID=123320 RepID=A0A1T5JN00_9MICO|nr:signal peptidase II [Okibacterium fritillariae]SKC52776.1 signal peptidase II [Okibacterium fritillariae]